MYCCNYDVHVYIMLLNKNWKQKKDLYSMHVCYISSEIVLQI